MKILIAMEVTEEHKRQLQEAAGDNELVYCPVKGLVQAPVTDEELEGADVIIGNVAPERLKLAKKVRWVQLSSAGSDAYCKEGVLPDDVVLTNATGAYGLAIAEHMVGLTFAMMKKLYLYHDNQTKSLWHDEGPVRSISGKTVLVVGFGDIGREFGKRMKAMGAYVIGIRRRHGDVPPEADEMGTMERLDDYLRRADIVALSLPNTAATNHLFDKRHFSAMKEGSYFLNVGRGNSVVQADLIEAVKSGRIAGAGLDVTDPEPLPADDPLWQTPGIHITPHISGGYHLKETHDKIVGIAAENLRRFLHSEPLQNIVDKASGYKK